MNIRIVLDKRRPNREGIFPLKLSFSNLGKTVYHLLNIYVYDSEFDDTMDIPMKLTPVFLIKIVPFEACCK